MKLQMLSKQKSQMYGHGRLMLIVKELDVVGYNYYGGTQSTLTSASFSATQSTMIAHYHVFKIHVSNYRFKPEIRWFI